MKQLNIKTALNKVIILCAVIIPITPIAAQSVTGQINSQIQLAAACEVNGASGTSNVNFGLADFGVQTTLFSNAIAQVSGSAGNGIAIRCSPGSDATVTFVSGAHDAAAAGGGRAMAKGASLVPYDLYRDAAFSNVLANGATIPVTADGTVQTVRVYGRALGAAGLTAGSYSDTVSVRLDF